MANVSFAPTNPSMQYGWLTGTIPDSALPGTFLIAPNAGNTASQIIIGTFNATTAGFGIPLNSSRTFVMRGNADDGGVQLPINQAYLFGSRRMLLTYAQVGNISAFGGGDRLSVAADESGMTAEISGHWGMLEFKSGGKSPANSVGCAAIRADLNLQSGSTVSANSVVSAFLAAAEAISATKTGRVTVLHVANPQAGTYDSLMELGSATGCNVTTFTGNSAFVPNNKGTFTQEGQLKIYVNGSLMYIPYGTVA